jgi:AcrR family transcriptional regulator
MKTPASSRSVRSGAARGAAVPPQPLSPERIVWAALEEVNAAGLGALSTRKLGLRLGCEAMSIYHHYPSKQHLLDAMVDHAIGSMATPPLDQPAPQRLRHALHAYRAMAWRHPALFPLIAVHRLNTPTGVRFIESMLTLVQAVLPDPELSARHFRTLGYYLVGAGLDETSGYAKGPSAADPVSDEYILRECPRLVAAARYFKATEWDATFELGAEAFLEAIRHDAARLRRAARP